MIVPTMNYSRYIFNELLNWSLSVHICWGKVSFVGTMNIILGIKHKFRIKSKVETGVGSKIPWARAPHF